MNILIIGGSGFIGRHLTKALLARKDRVAILSRGKKKAKPAEANYEIIHWHGNDLVQVLGSREFDAIINLAGETIGKWPWSAAHKKRVIDSRVETAGQVVDYLASRNGKSTIYLQASGIGYYGDTSERELGEDGHAGSDFLANVVVDWEKAALPLKALENVRTCFLRTGIVLSTEEGVLPIMALPVRLFLGGMIGSGKQGVSWIHIDDAVGGYLCLLDADSANGVYNLCAPEPVSNERFIKEIGGALKRPVYMPTPAIAMRALLGEMSDLLLKGQYALPKRLLDEGYKFKFGKLTPAMKDLFGKESE